MAERPIFVPYAVGDRLVQEIMLSFHWSPGFASVQKQKSILALHAAAAAKGYAPILEISTKSDQKIGVRMSAFNLQVDVPSGGSIPLECAFQGSKVFEHGGPFQDIYQLSSREAKKDDRLRSSGRIIGFEFSGVKFPSEPKTAFYDWLYVRALAPHQEFLQRLEVYAGFSDIEFNPERSLNCQARAAALFVSLRRKNLIRDVIDSPEAFIEATKADALVQPHSLTLKPQRPIDLFNRDVAPDRNQSVIEQLQTIDVPFAHDPPTLDDLELMRGKINELIRWANTHR
jgi:hypothetical protein